MTDERTRRLLQRGAGVPPTQTPLGEIERRAARLRHRRRVAISSVATALVVVTVIGAVGLIAQVRRGPAAVALDSGEGEPTKGTRPPVGDGCVEPAFAPAYLPWIDQGQRPPAPAVQRTSFGTMLRWTSDADAATVTLTRRNGTVGGKDGREVPAMLSGTMGRLSTAVGGREVRIVWNLGGSQCNVLELALMTSTEMAGQPARREAIEIAQSLTPRNGDTPQPSAPAVCPAPPVVPTYMPWLSESETTPPGQVGTYAEEGDRYDLQWRPPGQSRDKIFYVSLSRYSDLAGYGGARATKPVIMGSEGMLAEGTMPGDVAIGWNVGGRFCNIIELVLVTDGEMNAAEAEREILRIADSFVPAPSDTGVQSSEGH
jgi:hypothetical protein